ncbi:hypothetical protein BDR06DRAFT_972440 [Suillus hirtellus]|nr:hypothetical protein BDR06DRAFT_972440 [Suillus hirtellus]
MSIPPEAANNALKVTLVIVQSLMKRCIKVKEGNPEALKLLDEIASCPAHPPLRYCHLYVAQAEREQWKALFKVGDSKKRKVDDEDTNGADVIEASKLASMYQELMKKKRKLNQNVDNRPTGIIDVKPKTLLTVTTDKVVLPGNEKAFWDADTWCWYADQLQSLQNGAQMLTLPLCARQKVQLHSTCMYKLRPDEDYLCDRQYEKQQPGLLAGVPMCTLPAIGTSPWPEQDDQPALANITNPGPTARDILQGIQDLSKRLDLFATNDHVDTLEMRVHLVENILHQQLNVLEQCLNASDTW